MVPGLLLAPVVQERRGLLVGHGRVLGEEVGHVLVARVVRRRLGLRGLHGKGREEQDPATLHNAATYRRYACYCDIRLLGIPTLF